MTNQLNRKTAAVPNTHPERIVQFGGGNFLRAFVDWIVDKLNTEADFDSSIVVVKASPRGMVYETHDKLAAQDGLYHLTLTGVQDGEPVSETSLIKSISRVINPYHTYDDYLALARQPEIRFIVSNTTEAGIVFDASDKLTDDVPVTFPAKLTVFLLERYKQFDGAADKGCIILPCELNENNGTMLRRCVLDYVNLWQLDDGFKTWLEESNVFCNTLVDRIVPGFPYDRAEAIREQVGFDDQLLVEGEQYHSWVIEGPTWIQDEFPVTQAALNVKFVEDITPYRDLKVRILNGAHTAMVPTGYLYGLRTVREAVEHEVLGSFVANVLFDEVLPTLNATPAEREQMAHDVLNRFRNPFLKHQLITISLNSTAKFTARVLPSLLAYQAQFGKLPPHICLAFAALICFYKGEWQGKTIPVQDDPAMMAWWQKVWQADLSTEARVAMVLRNEAAWGQDLTAVSNLTTTLTQLLDLIDQSGMAVALDVLEK
jgi:tagaturonate reductase